MMITSMPWLKMAPNCGGQCRMHVSQLMQSDISMRSGTFFHFGLRSRELEALHSESPQACRNLGQDAARARWAERVAHSTSTVMIDGHEGAEGDGADPEADGGALLGGCAAVGRDLLAGPAGRRGP